MSYKCVDVRFGHIDQTTSQIESVYYAQWKVQDEDAMRNHYVNSLSRELKLNLSS